MKIRSSLGELKSKCILVFMIITRVRTGWSRGSPKELQKSSFLLSVPFAWEARLPEMVTAYNGAYSYSDLQFYFEIRKLGESVSSYDNGGNPYLKYNVELQSSAPYSVCQAAWSPSRSKSSSYRSWSASDPFGAPSTRRAVRLIVDHRIVSY